jgi:hypothetical protein
MIAQLSMDPPSSRRQTSKTRSLDVCRALLARRRWHACLRGTQQLHLSSSSSNDNQRRGGAMDNKCVYALGQLRIESILNPIDVMLHFRSAMS